MTLDTKLLGSELSGIVRDYVAREVGPVREEMTALQRRIAELEGRAPTPGERGPAGRGIAGAVVRSGDGVLILTLSDGETIEAGVVAGEPGRDGRDIELDQVRGLVRDAVAELPPPEPGRDGQDGASVTVDDVAPLIAAQVERAVAALPPAEPGRDGRSVEPAEVRAMVEEAVAALPPAEPGRDGQDGTSVSLDDVAPIIVEEVQRQVAAIPRPQDGTSVTVEDVQPVIAAEVERQVSALPPPEPGQDGTSVTTEDVAPLIAQEVERQVALIPAPQPGRDGQDGHTPDEAEVREILEPLVRAAVEALPPAEPGQDGQDGTSVTVEEVQPLIAEEVQRAVAAIPPPENGRDGDAGPQGRGIADLLIDRDGELVATFTDGGTKRLGRIVGTDGRDGQDGQNGRGFSGGRISPEGHLHLAMDGGEEIDLGLVRGTDGRDGRDGETFTLDDFNLEVGESLREFVLTFAKGEVRRSFALKLPVVIDRGAWQERDYERGDSVSWGGSTWIAQREIAQGEKPGSSDAWRLSVKRGRDGKAGQNGRDADGRNA